MRSWFRELIARFLALIAFREATLYGERQRRRADEAETALEVDRKADKAAAGYDALSPADKLRYREGHGVYRD